MVGILEERRGRDDAAITSLGEAVRINPAYAEALLALASLHERRGDFDRSRELAERASQLSRSSGEGLDPTMDVLDCVDYTSGGSAICP